MLYADGDEFAVVDIVLAGSAVHVALVQLDPESVPCRLDVLSHVGAPAGKVDALDTLIPVCSGENPGMFGYTLGHSS